MLYYIYRTPKHILNIILFRIFTNASPIYYKGIIYKTLCCIGVTLTPCPNEVVASSTGPTLSTLNIIPDASPFI